MASKRELTDLEKELVKYAKEQYNHWQSVLLLYGEISLNGHEKKVKVEPAVTLDSNFTFPDLLQKLFSDGKPRLTEEIREEFIKQTGKEIDLKNFSSKLNTVRNRGEVIQNVKYPDLPLDRRYWWGLRSWFRPDLKDMKPEYKRKIPEFRSL